MNNLTAEFFGDIERIQNHSEDMEEALERLVDSLLFSRVALFYKDSWSKVCFQASRMGKEIYHNNPEQYNELLKPAIFLALCGLPQEAWEELRLEDEYCTEYESRYDSVTYSYLCNRIREEIEKDLLVGATLFKHVGKKEDEWPVDDSFELDQDAFFDEEVDVEQEALNNVLLEQIHELVSASDWDIITASHGDGPELAEKYGITEDALRKRRERLLNSLREELGNDY